MCARPRAAGDVELGGEVRILADAERDAVDPGEEDALGGPDVEHDPAASPAAGTRSSRSYSPVGFAAGIAGGSPVNGITTFV